MAVNLSSNVSKNHAAIKPSQTASQKADEMMQQTFKMVAAQAQNMNPFDDKSSNPAENMAHTFAVLQQVKSTAEGVEATKKLMEQQQDMQFSKAMSLQGMPVKYDTSEQEFNGSTIDYTYQLKYNESSKPKGAVVVCNLSILNDKGIKVHQEKGKTKSGSHKFIWDGKTDDGKIAPEGKYTLKVDAHFKYQEDGISKTKPIEAGCFFEGKVEALEKEGGDVFAIINGEKVNLNDLTKVDFSEKTTKPKPTLEQYAGYIGKDVVFENNSLEINDKGEASFSFDSKYPRPGKAGLKIYDLEGNLVGTSLSDNILLGKNTVEFKTSDARNFDEAEMYFIDPSHKDFSPLPKGKYKCELYIQDNLSTNRYLFNPIDLKSTERVTSLDFEDGEFVITEKGSKYPVDEIHSLKSSSKESSFTETAAKFMGKLVKVDAKLMDFDGRDSTEYIRVPEPPKDKVIKSADLLIFNDAGRQVAKVSRSKDQLSVTNKDHVIIAPRDEKKYLNSSLEHKFITMKEEDKKKILVDYLGFDESKYKEGMSFEDVYELYKNEEKEQYFKNFLEEVHGGDDYKFEYSPDRVILRDGRNLPKENTLIIEKYSDLVPNFDSLSEENKRLVQEAIDNGSTKSAFYWDGINFEGKKEPAGSYTYKLQLVLANPSSPDEIEIKDLRDIDLMRVDEYMVDDGELFLIHNTSAGQVKFKPSDIIAML